MSEHGQDRQTECDRDTNVPRSRAREHSGSAAAENKPKCSDKLRRQPFCNRHKGFLQFLVLVWIIIDLELWNLEEHERPTWNSENARAIQNPKSKIQNQLAERVGFEPTVPVKAQQFSRLPDSTTLAPLRA